MICYKSKTSKLFSGLRKLLGSSSDEFPVLSQHWRFFAHDYLSYNLDRKMEVALDGSVPDENLDYKAVIDFVNSEDAMLVVNSELDQRLMDNRSFAAIIQIAQRKISDALGDFDFDEYLKRCTFTTGSSTRVKRRNGNPAFKYYSRPHVTQNALRLANWVFQSSPAWVAYKPHTAFQVVGGSEFFTVPKQKDKRRGASKEPDMNLYLQKGIGNMIRARLLSVGISLNDQSRNQRLAREASFTGLLGTIDLSAASDSISLSLCRHLLPGDWYEMVLMTRSECITFASVTGDPTYYELEKVGTMGNGFTFELESLLFWGLTSAIVEHANCFDRRVGIFGDDIICDVAAVPSMLEVFSLVGFKINEEKSFWSGPFRESCGSHFHSGVDVTPFNVTHVIDCPGELAHFVNRLRAWGHRLGVDLNPFYKYVARLYPEFKPPIVPFYMGTKAGYLCDTYWELMTRGKIRAERPSSDRGRPYYCSFTVVVLAPSTGKKRKLPRAGAYLDWLRKTEMSEMALGDPLGETSMVARIPEVVALKRKKHRVRWWEDESVFGSLPESLM